MNSFPSYQKLWDNILCQLVQFYHLWCYFNHFLLTLDYPHSFSSMMLGYLAKLCNSRIAKDILAQYLLPKCSQLQLKSLLRWIAFRPPWYCFPYTIVNMSRCWRLVKFAATIVWIAKFDKCCTFSKLKIWSIISISFALHMYYSTCATAFWKWRGLLTETLRRLSTRKAISVIV